MKRVILITNIPTPYRIPLFNELGDQLKDCGFTFKVLFGALSYPRRLWKVDLSTCRFDYQVLSSRSFSIFNAEKTGFSYSGIIRIIDQEKPNVIITNGFSLATTKLWVRSHFKVTPYIIWTGSVGNKNRPESYLRRIQRKILIKKAKGFITYGTKAKEYLISLGAPSLLIDIGINTVDTKFFIDEAQKIREKNTPKIRDRKHLLYIGQFTKGKRLDLAFAAIKKLLMKRNDFLLELVGSGPELETLKNLTQELRIAEHVKFEGFRQKSDLPYYLAKADCFVFPSQYDIWGLVLVEAMSAGVPCISSIDSGATSDLIIDGETGFAVDYTDLDTLVSKINWVLDNPKKAKEMGEKAKRYIVNNVTLKKSANGFVGAIKRVLE